MSPPCNGRSRTACHHVAPADAGAVAKGGRTEPTAKVLDLKGRLRCRGCGRKGRAVVDEARTLLDSIDVTTIIGLRDRALIALLIYSFARISAALQMNLDDYYPQGKRWWVLLHEKGGKQHEMQAHHLLEQYLDAYVTTAGLAGEKASPLFRTLGGRGRKQLTGDRLTRQDARRMIVRRAKKAGLLTRLGYSFRATGITVYLLNGGLLEYAQQMAAHESARTTKLYDERIVL
jgi:integrase/recombinase XerD